MTTYNNSYDSDGLFGDPEGDEQEAYETTVAQRRAMNERRLLNQARRLRKYVTLIQRCRCGGWQPVEMFRCFVCRPEGLPLWEV